MSVMNTTKLNAQIRSIKGNSTKLRNQIQEVLVSCAYHAIKDGQLTPFNNLLEAVGSGTRIKGLTMWAETYGCVRLVEGKFTVNKTARDKTAVTCEQDFEPFEAVMRESAPWYDMVAPEKKESIFDAEHYLNGVIAKLTKEHEDGLVEAIQNAVAIYNLKVEAANEAEEALAA